MNKKHQLIGVRAGKGDSKWCSSVGHLPAWAELPGSPSLEKAGYEGEFWTKVKRGKGFLFIENHIFLKTFWLLPFGLFVCLFLYVFSMF